MKQKCWSCRGSGEQYDGWGEACRTCRGTRVVAVDVNPNDDYQIAHLAHKMFLTDNRAGHNEIELAGLYSQQRERYIAMAKTALFAVTDGVLIDKLPGLYPEVARLEQEPKSDPTRDALAVMFHHNGQRW